jgi:hypothetical protein
MEALKEWHDFFLIMGTAAGGLIGAMFVVASIGTGYIKQARALELRIFTTPTVMHLATVLFACALVFVPSLSRWGLGVLLGLGAIGGLAYAMRNSFHISRRDLDWSDRLWYAAVPVLAYVAGVGSASALVWDFPGAIELLAVALALILASGIRNAWDLIIFFIAQPPTPD